VKAAASIVRVQDDAESWHERACRIRAPRGLYIAMIIKMKVSHHCSGSDNELGGACNGCRSQRAPPRRTRNRAIRMTAAPCTDPQVELKVRKSFSAHGLKNLNFLEFCGL